MPDAFISYRRKPSAPLAHFLKKGLKLHRFDIYLDTMRTDSARVQFPDRLLRAVDKSQVFICLLAEGTLESEWVLREIERAYQQQKPCIPIFQESYKPPAVENPAVGYLLGFDGVHILDERGLYMDESVQQVAGIMKRTVPPSRRRREALAIPAALLVLAVIVAIFVLAQPAAETPQAPDIPTSAAQAQTTAPPTNRPAAAPATSSTDWTPEERTLEDSITMVLVPAGCFLMGSDSGDNDERPPHQQCFDAPFWIDKTEVTQADFARLGGRKDAANGSSGGGLPVESVTWFEARDFCELRGARLPTEAEWEYAARGPDSRTYPWGDEWNSNFVVWRETSDWQTANAGSLPQGASWVGALDMSGNVWEWISSLHEPYPYNAGDGRERDTGHSTTIRRVQRGGSWYYGNTMTLRGAYRNSFPPDQTFGDGGFRCARDHEP
jgi:formylglycine-generating enzyme required for sulfatase activity